MFGGMKHRPSEDRPDRLFTPAGGRDQRFERHRCQFIERDRHVGEYGLGQVPDSRDGCIVIEAIDIVGQSSPKGPAQDVLASRAERVGSDASERVRVRRVGVRVDHLFASIADTLDDPSELPRQALVELGQLPALAHASYPFEAVLFNGYPKSPPRTAQRGDAREFGRSATSCVDKGPDKRWPLGMNDSK